VTDADLNAVALGGTYQLVILGEPTATLPVSYSFGLYVSHVAAPIRITPSTVQPAPDLIVAEVTVSAAGQVESGSTVTVAWKDTNIGALPTTGSWTDRVVVTNPGGEILVTSSLPYDAAVSGALASGASKRLPVLAPLSITSSRRKSWENLPASST